MTADEEAAIAAIIAATFLLDNEREESMEPGMGIRNKRTRPFHILAILIPEL